MFLISISLFYTFSVLKAQDDQQYSEDLIREIANNSMEHLRQQILEREYFMAACEYIITQNYSISEILKDRTGKSYGWWLWDEYEFPIDFYAIVSAARDGKCTDLDDNKRRFCNAILTDDMSKLDEYAANLITSIENRDVNLCIRVEDNEMKCIILINEYWAIMNNNISECDNINDGDPEYFFPKIQCRSLVRGECTSELDKAVKDLVFVDLSREMNNLNICDLIENQEIMDLCRRSYMDFNSIVGFLIYGH